jgi:integrase
VPANPAQRLVPPTGEKWKVMPKRRPNAELRTKEYLTEAEIGRLMKAARKGRWGHRDATLILVMVRHGLRVTEAVDTKWDQIDWSKGHLHVRRLKGGIDSVHPLQGDELRALRKLHRVPLLKQTLAIIRDLQALSRGGRWLFPSVRSTSRPMSENTLNAALRRLGYSKDQMTAHGFKGMASRAGVWTQRF